MLILLAWFIGANVVACIADKKGRGFFGWLFLSMVISPLFGLILILCLGDKENFADIAKQKAEETALYEMKVSLLGAVLDAKLLAGVEVPAFVIDLYVETKSAKKPSIALIDEAINVVQKI